MALAGALTVSGIPFESWRLLHDPDPVYPLFLTAVLEDTQGRIREMQREAKNG